MRRLRVRRKRELLLRGDDALRGGNSLGFLATGGALFDPARDERFYQTTSGILLSGAADPVGLMLDDQFQGALGPELVDIDNLPTPTITDFDGSVGAWDAVTRTMSNTVTSTNASYPRFLFNFGLVSGKRYLIKGLLSGDISNGLAANVDQRIRLATSGSANGVGYNTATGVIEGRPAAAAASVEFLLNGTITAPTALTIESLSIREILGAHASQATTGNRPTRGRHPKTGVRNLLDYSEQFDNAFWVKSGTTIGADAIAAPDGTLTADKLIETATNAAHRVQKNVQFGLGTTNVFSIFLRAGERTSSVVELVPTQCFAEVDLTNGVITSSGAGGLNISNPIYTLTSEGGGWFRLRIAFTASTSLNINISVYVDQIAAYLGDGTSGIFLWGAQLELGSTATAYQRRVTINDVTEAGVPDTWFTVYNGTSHRLEGDAAMRDIFRNAPGASIACVVEPLREHTAAERILQWDTNTDGNARVALTKNPNGAGWTAVAAAEANQWFSVAYGNGVWIAVSSNGTNRVMRSTDDGATWSAVAATEANQWRSVAYANGVWIAVSSDGTNRVMRSTDDGATWSAVAAAEANAWRSVAYADGVWVAVAAGGTNRVMRSTDNGATWSAVAAAEANAWFSVAYGNGVWIAVSSDGTNRVMRSTNNGATWSAVAAAEANEWRSVAYANGVWIAVADSGTNRVMRSTDDGATWSAVAASEANEWRSVAYGNGVWIAVANSGTNRVMRSTDDGVTWSAVAAAEANAWRSVAYENGVWIAVAFNGTNRVMRAPAGTLALSYRRLDADSAAEISTITPFPPANKYLVTASIDYAQGGAGAVVLRVNGQVLASGTVSGTGNTSDTASFKTVLGSAGAASFLNARLHGPILVAPRVWSDAQVKAIEQRLSAITGAPLS
jgi:hypothetical protein